MTPGLNSASISLAAEETTLKIRLKWDAVPGVSRYYIQVGREESFRHILAESETPDSEWTWNYSIGTADGREVYYRVCSVDQTGHKGVFSEPQSVPIPAHPLSYIKARRFPRYLFQAGAMYHSRSFTDDIDPKTVKGSGIVPGTMEAQAYFPILPGDGWMGVDVFWAFEQGTSAQGDRLALPAWRMTLSAFKPHWTLVRGIGLSATSSNVITYTTAGQMETTLRPMGGVSIELGSDPARDSSWSWRFLPAFYGVGSLGADVIASGSYWPLKKKLFFSLTVDYRLLVVEYGSSAGVSVGYAF